MKISQIITTLILLFSFFIDSNAKASAKPAIIVAVIQLKTIDVGNFSKMRMGFDALKITLLKRKGYIKKF